MDKLMEYILAGDSAEAEREAGRMIASGLSHHEILLRGVERSMDSLSEKCTMGQFNLLEIMLAGRAVTAVMKLICGDTMCAGGESKGVVLLGSLRGDVHDLGKNIVKMALLARGYSIVDCGKDCPLEKLLESAENSYPMAIGISGLISTIVPSVRGIRETLESRSATLAGIPILAGGAALKQLSAEYLNVDYVAQDVFDGVKYIEGLSEEAVK